ncbi:Uncharacterized protein involved in exopolysaccharide biosynthesis [bacterium A37T11]|nr:Uncharacterized protein involved in exopolysaccharide biosynthesis [bacterium A37T11]
MIDINGLLKFLLRFIWLLILAPLIAIIITFFLVKDLPEVYNSTATIGTNSVISSQLVSENGQDRRQAELQQLNRVRDMMGIKRQLDMLSYRLIIHDLENPDQSFREYSDDVSALSKSQRQNAIQEYKARLINHSLLTERDDRQLKLASLVKSMGYDDISLLDDLNFEIREELGYINVRFDSENPDLSLFVVNNLSLDFIAQYNSSKSSQDQRSLVVLDSIVQNKKRVMDEKNAQLAVYSSNTGISAGGTQGDIMYEQILKYENQSSDVRRQIASLKGAINDINIKLQNPNDQDVSTRPLVSNNHLIDLDNQLQVANRRYVDNGFKPKDKALVDSLMNLRAAAVSVSSSSGSANSQANRQSLIQDRLKLETELSMAENSVSSIQNEINNLRGKYNAMMPADASVQNLVKESAFANQEYTEALNRYNQASLINNTGLKLTLVEAGIEGEPKKPHLLVLSAISGFAAFSLCFLVLTVIFVFDDRIYTAKQLASATGSRVIGIINLLPKENINLSRIWSDEINVQGYAMYMDFIRSLRFELDKELGRDKCQILGITSLSSSEGKTFTASSLAYSFALLGRKVLMISESTDNLFSVNAGENKKSFQNFDTFLAKKEIMAEDLITLLRKNSSNSSLLEIKDPNSLKAGFEILRREFDIVIIDIESLNDFNKAKEWLMFSERIIGVFGSESKISASDKMHADYLKDHPGFLGWILNKVKLT